jgi:hypothetical protein
LVIGYAGYFIGKLFLMFHAFAYDNHLWFFYVYVLVPYFNALIKFSVEHSDQIYYHIIKLVVVFILSLLSHLLYHPCQFIILFYLFVTRSVVFSLHHLKQQYLHFFNLHSTFPYFIDSLYANPQNYADFPHLFYFVFIRFSTSLPTFCLLGLCSISGFVCLFFIFIVIVIILCITLLSA